jgi:hypothetical protein
MKHLYFCLIFALSLTANAQIINTVAGNGAASYSGNGGQATAAAIIHPEEVRVDAANNFYISEFGNYVHRKVTAAGIINLFFGNHTSGFAGDGGQATAALINDAYGIVQDALGNFYCCDFYNARIRKISATGVVSEVAGNGTSGYLGDGGQGTAAELNWPENVCVDAANNVYVCDWMNNRVRKINVVTGIITTVVGTGVGGFTGDGGQATAAQISGPMAVCFDVAGNMYLADGYNYRIRKITPGGVITTIAGNGVNAYSGDGGQATAAELGFPRGVCVDPVGNYYIADETENRVRFVTAATGIIKTFAGNGVLGFSGDGGQATAAEIYYPCKVNLDAAGNLYICDLENNRIRKVGGALLPVTWLDFTADYNYNTVNLDWSTASETNNSYFSVERCTDGVNYVEIAQVKGAGNSGQTNYYSAIDESPVAGIDYYRLKQVDLDGHYSYSGVAAVEISSAQFTVFPNPVSSVLNIQYTASGQDAGPAVIKLYNLLGQLVLTHEVNAMAGGNTFLVDVSGIKEGLFILAFSSGSHQFTSRVIVNKSGL